MSTTNFYTPGFVRMVNVRLGQTLSPLVTGQLVPGGQIQAPHAQQRREIVLDRERERSYYFDGKLLKARDLLRDQNYLDARLRQAGRAFGAGIVHGLDAVLDEGWVSVQPGVAISPSGRILELKDQVLRAPVDDAALRAALNQGRYGYLSSGLYLLLVSWHEQTSDAIAEVYPREAGERPAPQPDAYEEGVRLDLMATPEPLPLEDELDARAALAERFLINGVELPGMPAESIALGLLAVRDNRPLWLDGPLVRRDYRRERETQAPRLRLAEHFGDLLADLVAQRHPREAFQLSRYFRRIPAFGPLPNAMVDVRNQTFGGFPDHYELDLVPVRADDIGFVREQAQHLPPLELTSPKVERVQILVPLGDAAYEALAIGLDAESGAETGGATDDTDFWPVVAVDSARLPFARAWADAITERTRSPFDRLRIGRRDLVPYRFRVLARSAWEVAFAGVSGNLGLYYVREFELAAIQAPQVLPISAGFPPPTEPGTGAGTGTGTGTGTGSGSTTTPSTIFDAIRARGTTDRDTLTLIQLLNEVIGTYEDDVSRVLSLLDNAYDRLFWLTLVVVAAGGLDNVPREIIIGGKPVDPEKLRAVPMDGAFVFDFLRQFADELDRSYPPAKSISGLPPEFNLTKYLVDRWVGLGRLLGDNR